MPSIPLAPLLLRIRGVAWQKKSRCRIGSELDANKTSSSGSGAAVSTEQMWRATQGSDMVAESCSVAATAASAALNGLHSTSNGLGEQKPRPARKAYSSEGISPCNRWVTQWSGSIRSPCSSTTTTAVVVEATSACKRLDTKRPPTCKTTSNATTEFSAGSERSKSKSGTKGAFGAFGDALRMPEQMSGSTGHFRCAAIAATARLCAEVNVAPTTTTPRRAPRKSATMGKS